MFEGHVIWGLSVLSERPGKSALMRPKGSAIQVDQGRDCTPIRSPIALEFTIGRDVLTRAIAGPLLWPSGLVPMP